MAGRFSFPETVNDTSARIVAGGVVAMATAAVAVDEPVLMAPLVYGFAARVLAGPRYSPLALLATRVLTPRLAIDHTFSPGPPKRLAQGIGLTLSTGALALRMVGRRGASRRVLSLLVGAAFLEAAFGLCLACRMYPLLVRIGLVPEDWCPACADIGARHRHHREETTVGPVGPAVDAA
jgi:hypothetical protein